jgi:hypothetical protein
MKPSSTISPSHVAAVRLHVGLSTCPVSDYTFFTGLRQDVDKVTINDRELRIVARKLHIVARKLQIVDRKLHIVDIAFRPTGLERRIDLTPLRIGDIELQTAG